MIRRPTPEQYVAALEMIPILGRKCVEMPEQTTVENPTPPAQDDKPQEKKEPTIQELNAALTNATAEVSNANQLMIGMGKLQELARRNVTSAIQWQRNVSSRLNALPEGLREAHKQIYDTCWKEMNAKLQEISEELTVIDFDVDQEEEIAF